MPSFEKPGRKDVRRPAFNRDGWNKVIRQSCSWINEHSHPTIKRDRTLCWNYALILINTGIRVGEARSLRWRDIRLEPQAPNKDVNVIFLVDGKTGEREIVARNHKNGVVEYLQRIKALYDDPKPDDFLFAHPVGKPIKSFKRAFSSLIKFSDVEFDGAGNRHKIYSCRHTYCVMRLTEGTGVYILARNMETSVAMIERYYGQTRTPDQAADLNKMRTNARTAGSILADLDA